MQPIQINVQVSIGLNSELFTLLSSVVNRPAQVAELPAAPRNKKPAKPQPEPKPEVTNQPTPTDGQATASEETGTADPAPEVTEETDQTEADTGDDEARIETTIKEETEA